MTSGDGELPRRVAAGAGSALERIGSRIVKTEVVESRTLTQRLRTQVFLKCEHTQITGSFKIRGALNKALSLSPLQLEDGVVVASTGNHGAAVAYACRALGGKCTVVVPEDISPMKEASIKALGAEVRKHGDDGLEAERFARAWAASADLPYISPYNDLEVITGQATVATEMLGLIDETFSVYVAVGGGGLISGIASVLKSHYPAVRIVGCSPEAHPVMDESVRVGRIVDLPLTPTLSDGTAGGIEHDTITLALCATLVDDWIRVTEEEIAESLQFLARAESMVVEGAAAVAVAAMQKDSGHSDGKRLAVLCGRNIDREKLERLLGA